MTGTDEPFAIADMLNILPVSNVLWVLFAFAGVLFVIFSLILKWHWTEYGTGKYTTAANMLVFLGVSAGFFVLMILSLIWYGLSS